MNSKCFALLLLSVCGVFLLANANPLMPEDDAATPADAPPPADAAPSAPTNGDAPPQEGPAVKPIGPVANVREQNADIDLRNDTAPAVAGKKSKSSTVSHLSYGFIVTLTLAPFYL